MAYTPLVDSQTLSFEFDDSFGLYLHLVDITLDSGVSYTVVWDGVSYTSTSEAASLNGTALVVLGNKSLLGLGEDTGEPFAVGYTSELGFTAFGTQSDAATHAVKLSKTDRKYAIYESTLVSIADNIRSKTGSTGAIKVSDMATAIDGITGGGSAAGCVTVTFMNGDEVLFTRPVYIGDDCPDPVAQGHIDAPTKASTESTVYTFAAWSLQGGSLGAEVLKNITEDTAFYAAYTESVRMYTVRFYDGETLLASKQFAYGTTPGYEATKDGYSFEAWEPAVTPVAGDISYYATWSENLTFAGATWSDISDACEAGEASKHFAVGDTRTITAGDYTYVLKVIALDTDTKADGSGKAGLTVMVHSPATDEMTVDGSYTWGSGQNTVRTWLSDTFSKRLSSDLMAVIKPVSKVTAYNSTKTENTTDTLFIPSVLEVFDNISGNLTSYEHSAGGVVYSCFINDHQNYRQFKNESGTKCRWWLRNVQTTAPFMYYDDASVGNNASTSYASTSCYVRPCFCI